MATRAPGPLAELVARARRRLGATRRRRPAGLARLAARSGHTRLSSLGVEDGALPEVAGDVASHPLLAQHARPARRGGAARGASRARSDCRIAGAWRSSPSQAGWRPSRAPPRASARRPRARSRVRAPRWRSPRGASDRLEALAERLGGAGLRARGRLSDDEPGARVRRGRARRARRPAHPRQQRRGDAARGRFKERDLSEWRRMLDVNLLGACSSAPTRRCR